MPTKRVFDARPDAMDFRDRMFVPTLVKVPAERPLSEYTKLGLPILDQGTEGACTGFGLSVVCHYLLNEVSGFDGDRDQVSPRMLYTMAKRYDEWPGTDYEGSSARGAIKGWHKHGVCSRKLWPNKTRRRTGNRLTSARARDAARIPLGAYFRVNHKDLVAMHSALNEVNVLYASAVVHTGWGEVTRSGRIRREEEELGGHAFAIVGYDVDGFWIQNSWGDTWGKKGFAHLSYADWLANGMDVWVVRLGVPVRLAEGEVSTGRRRGHATSQFALSELQRHIVLMGNDGHLRDSGQFATTKTDVEEIFSDYLPRITKDWKKPRILLYAHGGLVSEKAAIETVETKLQQLLGQEIYPIAFIWRTDAWSTLKNILRETLRRRKTEGPLDAAKDFMLDRLDDALEPLSRILGGRAMWNEMKENALRATTDKNGGARLVAEYVAGYADDHDVGVHLVGHSAGSILLAPVAQLLASSGVIRSGPMKGYVGLKTAIDTCHLWAPACSMSLYEETYEPLLGSPRFKQLILHTLTDEVERNDHCAHIYRKSLLYLVSNAFERRHRVPLIRRRGEPLLGMQHFIDEHERLQAAIKTRKVKHVLSPNQLPKGECDAAGAWHHSDFDDDVAVLLSTVGDILGRCILKPEAASAGTSHDVSQRRAAISRHAAEPD